MVNAFLFSNSAPAMEVAVVSAASHQNRLRREAVVPDKRSGRTSGAATLAAPSSAVRQCDRIGVRETALRQQRELVIAEVAASVGYASVSCFGATFA
jgi:hypothetical protein